MLNLRHVLIACFLISAVVSSCSKNENAPNPDLKLNYYPLNVGSCLIYKVDSSHYDNFGEQKFEFQIKDTVISDLSTSSTLKTVLVKRFKRNNDNDSWQYQKIFTRSVGNLRAEEFIDNKLFVRFIFPPEINKSWNGNAYNTNKEDESHFNKLDYKDQINGNSYDSLAHVIRINEINKLSENYDDEVYAKNIGLVKKTYRMFDLDFYSGKIIEGDKFNMEIISTK